MSDLEEAFMAVMFDRLERLQEFVEATGQPDARHAGVTLLMSAASNGAIQCVRYLIGSGADIHSKDPAGWTALTHAEHRRHVECADALRKAGAGEDLRHAIATGETAEISRWVAEGEELDGRDSRGYTHLLEAVRVQQSESAHRLIELGADVEAIAPDGETALSLAVKSQLEELSLLVLKRNLDANPARRFPGALLLSASERGMVRLAAELAARTPADELDVTDEHGRTALMWAARFGDCALVNALLASGARADLHDREGLDARWWGQDHPAVQEILNRG